MILEGGDIRFLKFYILICWACQQYIVLFSYLIAIYSINALANKKYKDILEICQRDLLGKNCIVLYYFKVLFCQTGTVYQLGILTRQCVVTF